MKISNREKAMKYKRLFFLVSVLIAVVSLVLFLIDLTIYGIAMVGVFSLWFLYFHVADFQFIEYNDESEKIVLRYFKVVGFGKGEYNVIEFPKELLQNAQFEHSIFGKLSDITIFIRTKRGIAEYPTVSLSAVPLELRKEIQKSLFELLDR